MWETWWAEEEEEAPPSRWRNGSGTSRDASRARAVGLGAQVFVEPTDLPDIGRFAVLADPTGAAFAVYRHAGA